MSKFIESELGKQMFDDLIRAAREQEETLSDDERAVKEQKTVLYKFYCKVMYRHLFKNGVCLRCGEVRK